MTRLTPTMARFCQQASCIFDGPLHDKEDGVKVSYLRLWVGDKGLDLFEGFAFAKPEDDLKLKSTKVPEKYLDLAKELTFEKAVEIGRNHEMNLNSLKKLSKGEANCEYHRKEETCKTNASTN
ncbi:unnamed protein product [Porites lobata]|uniref:Uncharacterized protein n=1 Tax=Porites lobata TaxID=104759 RepID=A0ABN8RYX8_9CNID|nr:unnamed protein product [Porites lobata]